MTQWLITGASGQLGGYLLRELGAHSARVAAWSGSRSGQHCGVTLQPVNLADPGQLATAFRQTRPALVIHAGARASVADCQRDPERARQVNAAGTAVLADLAAETGARLLLVSTDLVFDGARGWYREADATGPLSTYGRTKVQAEQAVLAHPGHLVVRVSLLFGPSLVGRPSFFDEQVAALRQGRPITLFSDEWRTPLGLATAAQALVALARSEVTGVLHLGGPERLSRLEIGQRLAAFLGADAAVIVPASRDQTTAAEPRPRDTSLDSARWRSLFPDLAWAGYEDALREMTGPPGV